MNAKFLQMRDRLKAEAAAHADAPEETPAPAAPNGKATGAGGKSTGAGGKAATTARGRRTAKTEPRTDDLAEARP